MALNAYVAQVRSLLNDPSAAEYQTADLTIFINDARVQIAGASESIRALMSLTTAAATAQYLYSTATAAPAGVGGVLTVRKARVLSAGVWSEVINRSWEWFFSYLMCGPAAVATGIPDTFAEFAPGISGSLFLSPIPNGVLSIQLDAVCYPIPLVDDSTSEALPYPWTEAVQYYSAYLALLSAQRKADADAMFERYVVFQNRATQMTTPTALPGNLPGGLGAERAGQHLPITANRQQPGRAG